MKIQFMADYLRRSLLSIFRTWGIIQLLRWASQGLISNEFRRIWAGFYGSFFKNIWLLALYIIREKINLLYKKLSKQA